MSDLYLAPMHGIMDASMRAFFTRLGGYDYCVTEFIRVCDLRLPRHVFIKHCPELLTQCCTPSATPVVVQLLGDDPEMMAKNAAKAVMLGAGAIDLNFGCPSPTVNRHAGGAVLLKCPEIIHQIVLAVRQHVPSSVPVTAKIRLGYDDTSRLFDNALAVQQAGASRLIVHSRTRVDGYSHPARWEWLAQLQQVMQIELVANGDINSVADYQHCVALTGCRHFMLGRGALAQPDLARQIKALQAGLSPQAISWSELIAAIFELAVQMQQLDTTGERRFLAARFKHWFGFLQRNYPEAAALLLMMRACQRNEEIIECLKAHVV